MAKSQDSTKKIDFDETVDGVHVAQQALSDAQILSALVEALSCGDRRIRQFSAHAMREIAKESPEVLIEHTDDLIDALHRPEAQTRWEILEVLQHIARIDMDHALSSLEAVEASLYDEDSGIVRLAAFRYFAFVGSLSKDVAQRVWPFLDECIQCYHGDPEFQDMLAALKDFLDGDIDSEITGELIKRMTFDAENGKGYIKKEAQALIEKAKGK